MSVDTLLDRLERVRGYGRGRWTARCPAHEDRGPSLSIRELDDGRVLVHCFGGCAVEQVIGAVGVDWEDLFPPRPIEPAKGYRRPFDALAVLRCSAQDLFEASVMVSMAAHNPSILTAERRSTLADIAGRLAAAAELAV